MAKIHTLTYNGTKSSDLGVFVSGSGSFDAAEFDVDKYEIPGRNGDLLLSNNRYKNIEITYPAFIPKAFMDKVQNVRNWLRSSKTYARLEDTYDMDHYRLGIPTGVQSFSPENRNDGANFEMTFDCKPQRFLKVGETPETVEADVQTETGEIVTFETVAESPITSASVSLSPIQSGSGDPSPDNIRPISGHTGAELNIAKHNIWDEEWTNGSINADTGVAGAGNNVISNDYIGVTPNTAYYATQRIRVFFYDANKAFLSFVDIDHTSFTTPSECRYILFAAFLAYGTTYNNDISINYPATDHEYHAYDGDTYSVTFPETIYGGSHEFVSGKAAATMAKYTITGANIAAYNKEGNLWRITITGINYGANNNYKKGLCDRYTMQTSYGGVNSNNNSIGFNSSDSTQILIRDDTFTTTNIRDLLNANPLEVVYPLATPLEYTLSPQQLTTLFGQNVVWGNGTITLTYAEPYNIDNPTLFDARPLFTVTNPAEGDVIMVNGQAITFVDGYTGTAYIDCETMNAFSGAANLNSIIQATDFPVLVPGTNLVTWTGAGECTMTPRWWEL